MLFYCESYSFDGLECRIWGLKFNGGLRVFRVFYIFMKYEAFRNKTTAKRMKTLKCLKGIFDIKMYTEKCCFCNGSLYKKYIVI